MSAGMWHEDLRLRMSTKEYTNWIKAGQCLRILVQALQPFLDSEMRDFHVDLLNQNTLLRRPCESQCRPSGNKLLGVCKFCSEWQRAIQAHQRQPQNNINWDNCSPASWRTNHWEVAKAFMPRGQGRVTGIDQFDASALLNLINSCDWFYSVDPKPVREVIRYRNELMHSSNFFVVDEWMKRYDSALRNFTMLFREVPSIATAERQIRQMLRADLSVHINGWDQMDLDIDIDCCHNEISRDNEISRELIIEWEAELLQERLNELLEETEEHLSADRKELEIFFEANKDLMERFSSQLQNIHLSRKAE